MVRIGETIVPAACGQRDRRLELCKRSSQLNQKAVSPIGSHMQRLLPTISVQILLLLATLISSCASGSVQSSPLAAAYQRKYRQACETPARRLPPHPPAGAQANSTPSADELAQEGREVRRTIESHLNEVQACYDEALTIWPALKGRLEMKFIIAPEGEMNMVAVKSDETGSHALECCVIAKMRGWRFAAPINGGINVVTYPFVFEFGRVRSS